jgi:predicted RNase H-like HicB family nuclease
MKMPKIRWVGEGRFSDAMIGPFRAASVRIGHEDGKWYAFAPDMITKIAPAASGSEARAIAERWIAEEWSKLMVAALSQDNEK